MTDTTDIAQPAAAAARRAPLSQLRLGQLQELATSLGVQGTATMRKSDLLAAIRAEQGGSARGARAEAPAADAGERTAATSTTAPRAAAPAEAPAAPPQPRRGDDAPSSAAVAEAAPAAEARQGRRPRRAERSAGAPAVTRDDTAAPPADTAPEPVVERAAARGDDAPRAEGIELPRRADRPEPEQRQDRGERTDRGDRTERQDRAPRQERGPRQDRQGQQERQGQQGQQDRQDRQDRGDRQDRAQGAQGDQRLDARAQLEQQLDLRERARHGDGDGDRTEQGGRRGDRPERGDRADRADRFERTDRADRGGAQDGDDDDELGGRRGRRGRYRDRKRRGRDGGAPQGGVAQDAEPEVGDDEALVTVAGVLDVLDSYAFVRTSGYLPGPNDVYVTLAQLKKHGMRKGDVVTGAVRARGEGDGSGEDAPGGSGRGGRQQRQQRAQKFNPLVRVDTVNGLAPDEARRRPDFSKLTPLYPQERLRLETERGQYTQRVIDLVAPIGKGQRGLIVAPPKAGKTIVMQQIANAITRNNPDVHLMVVLVDERPEEVTDMQRTVKGEVIASTFDRPAEDHTTVAELAIERAKRLVELGHDVVVLLDSLTRLSRAYNTSAPASGRILSGGIDASALYPPKRFFGAARNIENGGSLTILASALVETGSKADEVIFEEFKGTGNMELRLARHLADKRIFPAVDVNASGTRREEILMSPEEMKVVYKLRRVLGALDATQAIELVLGKLRETGSNAEFLMQVQRTAPAGPTEGRSELSRD
ncbi:transcription termination factor Rho [Pseudokineococcus lusitanus]|uniref:Transcription termination factor Rho n=1 Tax=Pseudokineococcus lusitanus TaxID=763993 RepID=A0A3N1HN46_9ACTN|nr:transcription termination factor Rho [Pseudokineococcus lusitanus]ROP43880.1 transcription termination factor Rho [Pseudokineococcus lusitanus]